MNLLGGGSEKSFWIIRVRRYLYVNSHELSNCLHQIKLHMPSESNYLLMSKASILVPAKEKKFFMITPKVLSYINAIFLRLSLKTSAIIGVWLQGLYQSNVLPKSLETQFHWL